MLLVVAVLAATPVSQDSGYEDRLVEWGLSLHGRALEPNPEGKRLEEVLVASEDVFAPSDPYPLFLNLIHVKTREPVIRREVLLKPGDVWDPHRVLTERIVLTSSMSLEMVAKRMFLDWLAARFGAPPEKLAA